MKDALAYFATGDAVFTDIPLMANAYSVAPHTNPAAATPFGLNILSHIAAARRVSSRLKPGTTPAAGATLAHDVAECMNLGSLDLTFATTAIGSGIFEVRGGDGDSQSAALAYPEHFPRWGVESETATWPTTPTVRVPRYEMGRQSVRQLLRRLSGDTKSPTIVSLGFQIIDRESA
jgi:hypothetical protein